MPLHRGDVLAGALDQLDRDGLEKLTMQSLSRSLGVRPGALYWHYTDKRALIDAMAEAVVGALSYDDDPTRPWEERLQEFSQALHAALLSRRDGARLVAGTFVARTNTLRAGRDMVGILHDAGLDVQQATVAALSVFYYILGYTIEEQSRMELARGEAWAEHQDQTRELMPGEVGRAITQTQNADTFDDGIRILTDGIRSRP